MFKNLLIRLILFYFLLSSVLVCSANTVQRNKEALTIYEDSFLKVELTNITRNDAKVLESPRL